MSIFFLMLLFLIALALFRVIPVELHSAGRSRQDLQAHYACSAGIQHAVGWLGSVVNSDPTVSIGGLSAVPYEPFEMPDNHPNTAYINPDGYQGATGSLATKLAQMGNDFDNVPFSQKPYMVIKNDLQIGTNVDSTWFVRVWIFPDRQTYPIPEQRPELLYQVGQPNGDQTQS
ncbi:MAG: hypothetical protein AB1758_35050, partial [Candidatus Eremiobacterota bacterium]